MSADDGYLIRELTDGKFALQHINMSADTIPAAFDGVNASFYETLEAAVRDYARIDNGEYRSEYGLRVELKESKKDDGCTRDCDPDDGRMYEPDRKHFLDCAVWKRVLNKL